LIERELSCLGVLLKEKLVILTLLYSSLVLKSEGFGFSAIASLVVNSSNTNHILAYQLAWWSFLTSQYIVI
jgi:hypothetical protein